MDLVWMSGVYHVRCKYMQMAELAVGRQDWTPTVGVHSGMLYDFLLCCHGQVFVHIPAVRQQKVCICSNISIQSYSIHCVSICYHDFIITQWQSFPNAIIYGSVLLPYVEIPFASMSHQHMINHHIIKRMPHFLLCISPCGSLCFVHTHTVRFSSLVCRTCRRKQSAITSHLRLRAGNSIQHLNGAVHQFSNIQVLNGAVLAKLEMFIIL